VLPSDPSFYKTLLDRITDGVYFVDVERRILFWNEAACRLTGYTADELLGRSCPDGVLCHVEEAGQGLCDNGCPVTASLSDGQSHEVRVFLRHKLGRRVPVTARVEPIRGADGSIIGSVQIFSDDSAYQDARRRIEEMERLAFFDHITDLPNRRFAEMSLQTALSEYHSHQDSLNQSTSINRTPNMVNDSDKLVAAPAPDNIGRTQCSHQGYCYFT